MNCGFRYKNYENESLVALIDDILLNEDIQLNENEGLRFFRVDLHFEEHFKNRMNQVIQESERLLEDESHPASAEENRVTRLYTLFKGGQISTEEVNNIHTNLGTLFHEYTENPSEENERKIREYFTNYNEANDIDKITDPNKYPPIVKVAQNLRNDLTSQDTEITNAARNKITEMLKSVKKQSEELIQYYENRGYQRFTESKLVYTDPDKGITIKGTPDLIFYKNDNGEGRPEVIIIDLKTSTTESDYWKAPKKEPYYLQLAAYEQLLKSLNIIRENEDVKVKLLIKPILLVPNLSENTIEVKFENKLIDVKNLTFVKDDVKSKLDKFLTIRFGIDNIKHIASEEVKQRTQKILDLFKFLHPNTKLDRFDESRLKEFYLKAIDKRQPRSIYTKDGQYVTCIIKKINDSEVVAISKRYGEEEFRGTLDELVKLQIDTNQDVLDSSMENLLDIFRGESDVSSLRGFIRQYFDSTQGFTPWFNLKQYASEGNWRLKDVPELQALGIICLEHMLTNQVDFIIVTKSEDELASKKQLVRNQDVLGEVIDRNVLSKYKRNIFGTNADILIMRALIAIAEFRDMFIDENFKIGNIKAISLLDGTSTPLESYTDYIDSFKILEMELEDQYTDYKESFKNIYQTLKATDFVPLESRCLQQIIDLNTDSDETYAQRVIDDDFKNQNISERLRIVQEAIRQLENSNILRIGKNINTDYKTLINSADVQTSTLAELIIRLKQYEAILLDLYSTNIFNYDYGGFNLDEVKSAFQLIKNDQILPFTVAGLRRTGLLQSLTTSTAYNDPDEISRMAVKLIESGFDALQEKYLKHSGEVNEAAQKFVGFYFKQKHKQSGTEDIYKKLLQTNSEGIDPQLILKNPYLDQSLNQNDKEFLEIILWHFNRLRMNQHGWENLSKCLDMTYAELKNSEYFEEYKSFLNENENEYLLIPLRDTKRNLFIKIFKDFKNRSYYFKKQMERIKKFWTNLGQSGFREEQDAKIEHLTAVNPYSFNADKRQERLEKNPLEIFEYNFNFLTNDYIFETYKQLIGTQVLEMVDSALAVYQMYTMVTGESTKELREHIIDRLKVSWNSSNLMDNSQRNNIVTGLVGLLKKYGNLTKIAFRPVLTIKELAVGFAKLESAAKARYLGKGVTEDIVTKAWNLVVGERISDRLRTSFRFNHHAINEKQIIHQLCYTYRFANLDANIMTRKTTFDQFGFGNMLENSQYVNVTEPDWYNKMTVVVAIMMANGSFYAHKVENGKLIYDMSKDKRFDEFWAHKDDPNYYTENFAQQKALYIAMMEEFNKERLIDKKLPQLYYGQLEDGVPRYDHLPRAYTAKDVISMKNINGRLFGFMDHEQKALYQNSWGWGLLTHFKTYLPGELTRYLAIAQETTIGDWEHIKDVDGKKLYYYYNENNEKVIVTENNIPENVQTLPVKEYVYSPVEGLYLSLLGAIKYVKTINRTGAKLLWRDLRARNCIFLLLHWVVLTLGRIFMSILGREAKESDNRLAASGYSLLQKITSEFSFIQSCASPLWDIELIGPSYVEGFLQSVSSSVTSFVTDGDVKFSQMLYRNASFFKDYQPLFDDEYKFKN